MRRGLRPSDQGAKLPRAVADAQGSVHTAPNQALEPTPYSVRSAPAFGRGSPLAFGRAARARTGREISLSCSPAPSAAEQLNAAEIACGDSAALRPLVGWPPAHGRPPQSGFR